DIRYFNITISNYIVKLVATGGNIEEPGGNIWNKGWGLNSWNARYTCSNSKLNITIKPTNGAVTEGSWECEVSQPYYDNCRLDGKNKTKAHIYEENGYLMHEILFNKKLSCWYIVKPVASGAVKHTKNSAHVDITTGFMNNFNRELLMFVETLLDVSKYIFIRKRLNRGGAQEYCSEKYENGTLCSFQNEDDWTHLTKLIEREPNQANYYWTGLKGTLNFEFSDGTSTDYAEEKCHMYVREKKMLTQPQAQEYCSKLNGILHDFQSNITNHQDDVRYWAGLVYIEEIKKYGFSDGYLSKGVVDGNQNGGKLCVMAKMEDDNKSPKLRSSKCCDKRAYVICKVPKDGRVAGKTVSRIMVKITVDNTGRLITDSGEKRNVVCSWKKVKHFTLSGQTKHVTIKAHNARGKGGILASFSNKVVTDGSWECADMSSCTAADCAPWTKATTHDLKEPWNERNQIKSTAQWIWAENEAATRVWCRKRF
ncbi:Hypothetical predicted protein, partial [Paramuricea clavata]